MPHKYEPARLDRLDSPGRLKSIPFEGIFSRLPLQPHQVVADIGCGTGTFSLPLAQRLPQGKVYCLDIAPEMLERVRRKLLEKPVPNLEVRQCQEMVFPVEPGSLDGVFLAFVLHEQEDRVAFLQALSGLLRPGGWVGVVDWQKRRMKEGPPLEERITPEEAQGMAREVGLRVIQATDLTENFYMLVLKNQGKG